MSRPHRPAGTAAQELLAQAERFPPILTSPKSSVFCRTQHRALSRLRKRAPYPEVEVHSTAAQARGIAGGDWVSIRLASGVASRGQLLPVVAEVRGEPIGLAWGRIPDETDVAALYQIRVERTHCGAGAGHMLPEVVIA